MIQKPLDIFSEVGRRVFVATVKMLDLSEIDLPKVVFCVLSNTKVNVRSSVLQLIDNAFFSLCLFSKE